MDANNTQRHTDCMTTQPTKRINARLEAQLASKVGVLCRHTRKTTSAIVRESLELYFEKTREAETRAFDILKGTGFVACTPGDPDLSTTYKDQLLESLEGKT